MELVDLPNGLKIWLEDRSEVAFLYEEIFEARVYLPELINLDSNSVVFDIGANIGLATVFFARVCGVASVLAFEPVPASFGVLEANFKLHRIKGSAIRLALSDKPGHAVLTHYPHASAKSGLYPDKVADESISRTFLQKEGLSEDDIEWIVRRKFMVESTLVTCKTLSDALNESGVAHVDLLKLDVEKSEFDVLQGVTSEHWEAGRIRQMVVEVHDIDGRLSHIDGLLKGYGYRVDICHSPNINGGGTYALVARLG